MRPVSSIMASACAATSDRATSDDIGRLIDAVIADEAMRRRCEAMAERARGQEGSEDGMRALEALAERP